MSASCGRFERNTPRGPNTPENRFYLRKNVHDPSSQRQSFRKAYLSKPMGSNFVFTSCCKKFFCALVCGTHQSAPLLGTRNARQPLFIDISLTGPRGKPLLAHPMNMMPVSNNAIAPVRPWVLIPRIPAERHLMDHHANASPCD